ncbi:translation initiation factor IF-3, mitochondrial [Sorex araneus]|uniref:translation initiation factor IF-3, mitochondrial n=1 Tax=Sorex araneus TaxID=42254 RepID=UPI0003316CEE|nr:translation initiation factor IF-3, mitochondrial [Sorex araneus]XP_055001763.1 translation initiation factor IF-3, mitochondrial [Sorex araneus]
MACLFLKRLALQAAKTEGTCIRCFGKYLIQNTALAQLSHVAPTPRLCSLIHAKAFSTVEDPESERTKEKAFGSVGRKIHERIIHVIDEKGNDLGNMHRADVIRLLNERDLKLVKRNMGTQPPEYQLMTGIQIQEERLRLREMEKSKPKTGTTLTKELTFSSNIGQHDLDTKTKQIQQWIEKKYKVQITIKKAKKVEEPENKMEETCNQLLQALPGIATFASRPQSVRGGSAVMCVLRPLSKKEEKAHRDTQGIQTGEPLNKDHGNDHKADVLHQ